ncbi:unnamed protein product [Hymenolepis diminuta]|uniref:TRUD domain-containing protein n=1 Tax=Hymenolepis diminuta TaxID=6216 RepID=A0A0R3SG99_HYMDI|nr:unnamed protein product [Hymenolepis diminuta]
MATVEVQESPPESKRPRLDDDVDLIRNTLSERDVGILEWEDFLVREVDLSGNVCRLSSIVPDVPVNGTSSVPNFGSSYIIPIEIDEVLKEIDRETMSEASFPASEDKEEREAFHKAIRLNYPSLVSQTTEVDGNRFITVTRGSLVKGKKAWERVAKSNDPPKKTPYCRFVLYKEGKDTMQALHIVSRMLKINSNSFNYAGTKDKRAITTQNVSIKNISARRLSTLNPRLNGIKIGNFSYTAVPIKLGELYGNRFSIVIRDICAGDSVIHRAIQDWQKHGFINYFGLQRFGHCADARTFDIGREIIRANWENAINLILTPTNSELPVVRQMKELYQKTQDAKACGDDMPQCLEKTLLLGIVRYGKTLSALQTLPRNLRQLYAHSYQSLVWNKVASRRIRELGVSEDGKALVGDLYFPDVPSISKGLRSVDSSSELCIDDSLNPTTIAVPDPEPTTEPAGDVKADEETGGEDESEVPHNPPSSVTPATPSRVTEGGERPLLSQVVLPLPGYEVIFPDNESGKWYSEILGEDSLKVENFKHKVKDFALPGSYRHLIVKPEDVHYEIREYSDVLEPLVHSDYAIMNEKSPVKGGNHSNEKGKCETTSPYELVLRNAHLNSGLYCFFALFLGVAEGECKEKSRALILEFTLPKAAYATMAIRELMKNVTVVQ